MQNEDERAKQRRLAEARLESLLLPAIESLKRGEGFEVTPEYWEQLRQEARQLLAELQSAKKPE
jgi:hypothetical protein